MTWIPAFAGMTNFSAFPLVILIWWHSRFRGFAMTKYDLPASR